MNYIRSMKILTWNIERLKTISKREKIIALLHHYDADIIVLTETTDVLEYGKDIQKAATSYLPNLHDGQQYKSGENRTTVFSKYSIIQTLPTYNTYNAVCADIRTPLGLLRVYGTVTGALGGKGELFASDLKDQLHDFDKLLQGHNCCIAGDLNTFFSGYAYPSHAARTAFITSFEKLDLKNLTADIPENVDHIVISNHFIKGKKTRLSIFNEDKTLSDHIGICIEIL